LAIDNCHPKLFGVGGVKQHAFHALLLKRAGRRNPMRTTMALRPR
jgi:hypothetical protein